MLRHARVFAIAGKREEHSIQLSIALVLQVFHQRVDGVDRAFDFGKPPLLGQVLAAGLVNRHHERVVIRESIEEAGRLAVFELERYLNTLGTIAAVSPLLGLLGTVFGMIQMFGALKVAGAGDPAELAGGIGQALITTAAGLCAALDLFRQGRLPHSGFIRQEQVALPEFLANRFGAAYASSRPVQAVG